MNRTLNHHYWLIDRYNSYNKQNNKLIIAIFLSIMLHMIAALIIISIYKIQDFNKPNKNFASVKAVIFDPKEYLFQQYNYHQQIDKNKQYDKHDQQHELEKLSSKQLSKQTKFLDIAKKHVKTSNKKQHIEMQNKQYNFNLKNQNKKSTTVKDNSNYIDEKSNIKQQINQKKSVLNKSKEINTSSSKIIDNKTVIESGNKISNTENTKYSRIKNEDINEYKSQLIQAISNKFYDSSSYNGKTCDLHIKLTSDGSLIFVSYDKGDPLLCQAAISAANMATIPKPPNKQIYKIFKNVILKFEPH